MATDNEKVKVSPIRENTPEKKELIDFFKEKKWDSVPGSDRDLDALMMKNNWNRDQVTRHFKVWYTLGADSNRNIVRSKDDVIACYKERCDSAEEMLKRTKASHDIEELKKHVILTEDTEKKMNDPTLWKQFMSKVFAAAADSRALNGNGIPQGTAKYCIAKEDLVQELWKTFNDGTVVAIRSFFYVFAREFVSQIQHSFAEPDVAEFEAEVIQQVFAAIKTLPKSHAETLYFILGFIINAAENEGTRRKSKGALFKAFAERSCLTKEGITKAREVGELPMEKTDIGNKGGRHYPTRHFYLAMTKVEQIYCALLTDDNLVAFGTSAMTRIDARISSDERVRSQLGVVIGRNAEGADDVIDFVLQTYRRVRGSDIASKLLARSGRSYATATRTDLQVKSESKNRQDAMPPKPDKAFLEECGSSIKTFIEEQAAAEDQLVRTEIEGEVGNSSDDDSGTGTLDSHFGSDGESEISMDTE